ncbi:exodeoxyribonuclease VII large subunit [Chitinophaga sp. Cy-1792]|uniref:exodeoxyribonuclease VII large subunit n=1 Tax=Chitinophaga sp. Cy-1792 TaxID=2608339 RepID=UPI001421C745|nr:exodeoxyribonuclease VII large subunit [Chitinophaga sp. Cy-1792]NIG55163.1 exodeoxyribonuclease VII large subunit [Chitinophaga sp. Cy-1792]
MTPVSPIRLSDLTTRIRHALQNAFAGQSFWVKADVTSYSWYAQKGIHYFDLVEKDETGGNIIARIPGVAWGPGAKQIKAFELLTGQQFRNNIHILALVSVAYHQVHGLQITLQDIDINFTIGQLEAQKQLILQRLVQENPDSIWQEGERYITRNHQLPLPLVIQRIAVVSSGNSAGYQDFHHTLVNNSFGYTFQLDNYFTVVQGENNADVVQQRMVDIFLSNKPYDAVVIIRGGGAQTDFLLFDSYQLGRVVARFPIPVITGIGHQKNETIVDLMANTATKTPTKAAELIIAHNRAFEDKLLSLQQQTLILTQQLTAASSRELNVLQSHIVHQVRSLLETGREELMQYKHDIRQNTQQVLFARHQALRSMSNTITAKPQLTTAGRQQQLTHTVSKLRSFSRVMLQHQQAALKQQEQLFRLMAPDSMLKRGFALLYREGKIITSATELTAGEEINIMMHDGSAEAIIQQKTQDDGGRTDI